ncbi:Aspartyl/glutamyl-tRNA(Asn/Gln) amidotransferase subunit C [Dermatophilus congolensis]|uniref:Aspartyl/glutamyl-tRNA(Asn/Gln) amidotransferase subunit C n=2 Tax=Dermatophilus congolensis TaxID=1863 RepID=A0AA46BLP8_9MICO|nr:Aspartyl/glutamyl-tRNA(Asn/Gln) amidotransferase subunit C [Dermatophilus congolensis]
MVASSGLGVFAAYGGFMASISKDQVAHLAMLARIEMDDEELSRLAGELDGILDAVALVGEVASADVEPMANPVAMNTVLRADEPREGLSGEAVLGNAPEAEDGRFVVPRILGED